MKPGSETDFEGLGDNELALEVKRGNLQAFEELVRRRQGLVYAVAYRITLNRDDALDVTQEALLKVYRKIGQWQPTVGFVPWLMRITSNQAIDTLRRRKRGLTRELDESRVRGLPAEHAAPHDTERSARAREIGERVDAALVALSPAQRAVFAMRHYEGLQLAEIAEALECSVGSVKVHLFRALKKLQKELADLVDES